MATALEIDQFLAKIERKAFKQAVYAVRNDDVALDLVQEAMMKLVQKYSNHSVEELSPLFNRILHNATMDYFRREKLRHLWLSPLSIFHKNNNEENNVYDVLETLEVEEGTPESIATESPADSLERRQVLEMVEKALQTLPARQREAFVLRYWEDLDIAQTAAIMGCSEGSVKTHCFRANHTLAKLLKAQGITL